MKRLIFLLLFLIGLGASPAVAGDCDGIYGANQVCGSVSGGAPGPTSSNLFPISSASLDAICSTNNDFLIRLTGTWQCGATGTSGHAVPFLDGANVWSPQTIGTIYGSSIPGGTLNLYGTSNGSPSFDDVNIIATNLFFYSDIDNAFNNTASLAPGTGPNGEGFAFSMVYHNKDNTGPTNGRELGFWQAYAWDGTQQAPTGNPLAMVFAASENWTATHHGSVLYFQTIPNGTANAVNEFAVGNGVVALASGDSGETQGTGQGTFNARNVAGYYIAGNQFLSSTVFNSPPTVNSSGSAPTCAATGIGSTGSCAFNTGSNDYAGLIELTVGGSGISDTGTITLTLNTSLGANSAACILVPTAGSANWTAPVTIINTTVSKTAPVYTWYNATTNFTTGQSYNVTYHCVGY